MHNVQSNVAPASTRTLMVSTSYPADGADWRGVFIRHLTNALSRRADLQLGLWAPPGAVPGNVSCEATPDDQRWLEALMASGGIAHLMRSGRLRNLGAPFQLLARLHKLYRRAGDFDIYHVNWLQNSLPIARNRIPLLVTVLGTDLQLLKFPGMSLMLRRAFMDRQVAICPNADWMLPVLQDKFGDVARIAVVPFGIEPRWFSVQRSPTTPHRWLCVSRLTRGKLGDLLEWGEPHFKHGQRELHLLGPMQESISLPEWVHYHGATDPGQLCDRWFPEATGLITLSRHAEGRPQVMLEAMAAGLPIIASRIPAHSDLLRHDETGWLCGSVDELQSGLEALESSATNIAIGERARRWVQTEIGTWDDCAERYTNIYRELLGHTN